jgi:outer membrane protein
MKRAISLSLGLLCLGSAAVRAEDLLTVFDRAVTNDPQIREANANRLASREAKPQAIAALLPLVTASASRTKEDTSTVGNQPQEVESPPGSGTRTVLNFIAASSSKPTTKRWSFDLTQSVFSWANWMDLKRADHQVAQAEADYQAAQQLLISRVATAYFNVLSAQDTVEAQQSAFDSISRQLEQADKRFEVGLIAITDVQEAKAARDSSAAALINAKRTLATNEELLREITGEKYEVLSKPGETIPLESPQPGDVEQWVQRSMDQNLTLISSRLAADIARDNVRASYGGHLPQVSLVASRSNNNLNSTVDFASGNRGLRSADTDDTSVGLQVTVPLFSGGLAQSNVRQSEYLWQAARERLTRVSRQTERQARDAYLGVMSEISRVSALRQGLESSQTALRATEAGYEVGTRTAVDVLDARRLLVQAQTDYSRSKYDYVINVLNLRLASGTLDRDALSQVNGFLTQTVRPGSVPPPPPPGNGPAGTTTPAPPANGPLITPAPPSDIARPTR